MDPNPYSHSSGFIDLLNSQTQDHIDLESSEVFYFNTQATDDSGVGESTAEKPCKERRTWSMKEDLVLISAWLNTSKDPVVENEQRAKALWTRIGDYYNSSIAKHPELAGTEPREAIHIKQRWTKINDQVCKFVGCYEAVLAQKKSGRNIDDVQKVALEVFFSDQKHKFMLEHAWLELRHDQKWCASNASKAEGSSKRRKVVDGEVLGRPAGVKASKGKGKRTVTNKTIVEEGRKDRDMGQFQNMWDIREKELAMQKELSEKRMLESLLTRTHDSLTEVELALKSKLMSDFLSK